MKKAKELIQEMDEQLKPVIELSDDERTDLKLKINDLLFTHLPSNITVSQMEALAFTIFHIITEPKEYLKP